MRFLLVLFMAAILTGCGSAVQQLPEIPEIYQYTTMEMETYTADYGGGQRAVNVTVPARFNVLTGTLTPLCLDPLCNHFMDSDCAFRGMNPAMPVYESDGKYYFVRWIVNPYLEWMEYDIQNASLRVILDEPMLEELRGSENGSSFSYEFRYGKLYYSEDDFSVVVDLASGEIQSAQKYIPFPDGIYQDRFIFKNKVHQNAVGMDGFYFADQNGENREYFLTDTRIALAFPNIIHNDSFLYLVKNSDNPDENADTEDLCTLYRYNLKKGKTESIGGDIRYQTFYQRDDWIYYTLYPENPVLIGYDKNAGKEVYNKTCGIIWRMNTETGEREKVFDNPEYNLIWNRQMTEMVGEHLVVKYSNTDYENSRLVDGFWHQYPTAKGRIVYNTSTGETKIYPEA